MDVNKTAAELNDLELEQISAGKALDRPAGRHHTNRTRAFHAPSRRTIAFHLAAPAATAASSSGSGCPGGVCGR